MEITEVRIKLIEDGGERLHAFCSITFDDSFVVRDLKIIEGTHGPFVAMPSRKLTAHCPQCGMKNHLRSAYCNQCGSRQREERPLRDEDGRTKLYADIAHPINSSCREMIQQRVIQEYQNELKRKTARICVALRRYRRRGRAACSSRGDNGSRRVPRRRWASGDASRAARSDIACAGALCADASCSGSPFAETPIGFGTARAVQDSIRRGIAVRRTSAGGFQSLGSVFRSRAGQFRRRNFRIVVVCWIGSRRHRALTGRSPSSLRRHCRVIRANCCSELISCPSTLPRRFRRDTID